MTVPFEIVIERIAAAVGEKACDNLEIASPEVVAATGFAERRLSEKPLFELAHSAASAALDGCGGKISAVIGATFSNEVRFPALSIRIASALGIDGPIPAFDLQMACSAYPYALLAAGQLAAAGGGKVLVVDGDVQSRFAADTATAVVASDACTASVVSARAGTSRFAFYSGYGEQLKCTEKLEMDGFGVFSFVASTVRSMIAGLLAEGDETPRWFVPHQANMYMVRQLAGSVGLGERLLTGGGKYGNVGSASVPLTLAAADGAGTALRAERVLVAGFGAGLSAAAGFVRMSEDFTSTII